MSWNQQLDQQRHKSIVDKAQRWALTTRLYRSTNKPLVDKENSVSKSTHSSHDVCTRSDRGSSILEDWNLVNLRESVKAVISAPESYCYNLHMSYIAY